MGTQSRLKTVRTPFEMELASSHEPPRVLTPSSAVFQQLVQSHTRCNGNHLPIPTLASWEPLKHAFSADRLTSSKDGSAAHQRAIPTLTGCPDRLFIVTDECVLTIEKASHLAGSHRGGGCSAGTARRKEVPQQRKTADPHSLQTPPRSGGVNAATTPGP